MYCNGVGEILNSVNSNVRVIRLGGSVLYNKDGNVNNDVLSRFVTIVKNSTSADADQRYIIVVGGGNLSRETVKKFDSLNLSDIYKHTIGMLSTHINAHVLQSLLGISPDPLPMTTDAAKMYLKVFSQSSDNILILGGFAVGSSTDLTACHVADYVGAKEILKISTIPYVYSANPDTHPNAQPYTELTWDEYLKVVGLSKEELQTMQQPPNLSIPVNISAVMHAMKRGFIFKLSGVDRVSRASTIDELFEVGTTIH